MNAPERPTTELDTRFSMPDAQPTPWDEARQALADAPIYWLSTIFQDERPHVTPLIGLFVDDAMYFCTGPDEQKAKNIVNNANCSVTTGCNTYESGLDIVLNGSAERVVEEAHLVELARAYVDKYGDDWRFEVRDAAFHHEGGEAWVFQVAPTVAFGFRKGDSAGQTRWRFS
jgi:hypothetical protein